MFMFLMHRCVEVLHEDRTTFNDGVNISQLIRFARGSSHVADFNAPITNKSLTAKLLQHGYRYHNLRKTFSKFYRRHYGFVSKFNVGLKKKQKHLCIKAYRNRNFRMT